MTETTRRPKARPKRSIFLPLALVSAVLVGLLLSDVYHGLQRNASLTARIQGLDSAVTDANKVRKQFDTLVKGVALLSDSNNPNARLVMAKLEKAGVNVQMDR